MTHICSRNGWQWAAPTRMSLKPSHKILVLYLCVAAWVAWANQVSVCFDSRALLLLPAARNPIHNYLQLPRTGRPAGCAPACHDRIGSDEQTSHNNSTHSVMIRDAIPHDSRIRIREKHFKKSGQMLTRLSPGPADLFDLFFSYFFFRVAFWIADLKVSTGWREEHSHALLPLLQLRNHLLKYTTKKFERNVRKEWCVRW